ncbi:MAG: hypothetical protein ACW99L_17795, partial [Promethearchaeota archaeon]
DANYTIYNPENTTTITVIVPFSLDINVSNFTFETYENNIQIPYDLLSKMIWDENISEIDIYYLPLWSDFYPITLIRSNVTLFANSTSIIRYRFSGSMNKPLNSRDFLSLAYYLGTSLDWKGNTTGRVEINVYGKQPIFQGGVLIPRLIDIEGGQSFINKWVNIRMSKKLIGIRYTRELTLFIVFIVIVIRNRRKRKEIESE